MTVIIPAYKPDEKLIALLKALKELTEARLLVVNDGSGEAFEPIFQEVRALGCTLLIHPENRGKGAALKTAFQYLLENASPDESFCTADADGQHLPKDIVRCLAASREHPGSLILGARSFRGEVPARSIFGNTVSRWTFHLLMGKRIFDTQTGLRAFTGDLLPALLSVKGDRYEYEMQMLCSFALWKKPILEVEIETVYLEENKSSHFNAFRDARRVYGILLRNAVTRIPQALRFLFSSALAFFVDTVVYYLLFNLLFPHFLKETATIAFFSLLMARITSSLANYAVNRRVVFHSRANAGKSLVLYYLLAVAVFVGNHYVNVFFLHLTGWHEVLCLVLAQGICFPISFFIQKYLIFPSKKGKVRE